MAKLLTKRIFSIFVLIILASLFGYYITAHLNEFKALFEINPRYLIALTAIFLLTVLGNGFINKYLLEPFNVKLNFKEWFGLSITTGFYNLITPFRGGMLSKAAYLKSKHKFGYTNFLASMIGVYVIQFWIVSIIGLITLWLVYQTYGAFNLLILLIFTGLFSILTTIVFFKIQFPSHKNRILKKIFEIGNGWNMIKNNRKIVSIATIVILSQVILTVMSTILVYRAIGINISVVQALFLTTIGMIASLASVTPGNLGISEAVGVLSGLILGITPVQSLSVGILGRVVSTVTLFILGPIFSYILIKKPKLAKK